MLRAFAAYKGKLGERDDVRCGKHYFAMDCCVVPFASVRLAKVHGEG